MDWIYFGIRPQSPLLTPITADTLWGHICWVIRERTGDEAVKAFIERFEQHPPFVISDAFPYGSVPMPLLPIPGTVNERLIEKFRHNPPEPIKQSGDEKIPRYSLYAALKKIRKKNYVSLDLLKASNLTSLLEDMLVEYITTKAEKEQAPTRVNFVEPHVGIDRTTLTAREGALYSTVGTLYRTDTETAPLWILAGLRDYDASTLEEYIREIGFLGFGADRSTGKGGFEVERPQQLLVPEYESSRSGMALAHFVPARDDPTEGFWRTRTKFGRVGGMFSVRSTRRNVPFTPFKQPIMMLTPGSVFSLDEQSRSSRVMGTLLHGVHRIPDVVHYAYTPVLPLGLEVQATTKKSE